MDIDGWRVFLLGFDSSRILSVFGPDGSNDLPCIVSLFGAGDPDPGGRDSCATSLTGPTASSDGGNSILGTSAVGPFHRSYR